MKFFEQQNGGEVKMKTPGKIVDSAFLGWVKDASHGDMEARFKSNNDYISAIKEKHKNNPDKVDSHTGGFDANDFKDFVEENSEMLTKQAENEFIRSMLDTKIED